MTYRVFCRSIVLAGMAAALAVAQTAPSHPAIRQGMSPEEAAILGMRDLRIAADLNLTAEQQTKIQAAFREAAEFRRGIVEQGRDLRNQLAAAVKAQDEAMIEQISEALGKILAQQIAFQANTVAKIYGVLTPEQRAKLDQEVKRSFGLPDQWRPGPRGL